MAAELYTSEFFEDRRTGSIESARQIVPFLKQITKCRSVIDVGCGIGTWLSAFAENEVRDFLGVDGPYVKRGDLLIPVDHFVAADLNNPPVLNRQFDLAVCLEVAEHLSNESAQSLIAFLTEISPVVAFSASIPFQNGTGHANEQWLEYWISTFEQRNYVPVDCIRARFWNNPKVDWWYAQNTILYVRKDVLERYSALQATYSKQMHPLVTWVHPRLLLHKQNQLTNTPTIEAWRHALRRTRAAVKRRLLQDGK